MNTPLAERITQCRELVGLSKTDLAEKLKVSLAAVSQWENGTKHPTTENLMAMAQAMSVPLPLFLIPIPVEIQRRGPLTFRAQVSAKTERFRKQAKRLAQFDAEAYLWLEKLISFPKWEPPQVALGSPEEMAEHCRKAWGLGNRPISKLGELMEAKGIRLCTAAFGDVRFDAFSCVMAGRPFIFLGNEKQDRARTRFDSSHELGHLIMHQHFSDDEIKDNHKEVERQANAFAGAFLMPADTFSDDVIDTSLEGFKRLKPKWCVSIQAMVRRAKDLEIISEETFERHCINMRSWRRAQSEPLDEVIPLVNRSLGKKSVELLNNSNGIKAWQIPSELPLPDVIFESVFEMDLKSTVPQELENIIVTVKFKEDNKHALNN